MHATVHSPSWWRGQLAFGLAVEPAHGVVVTSGDREPRTSGARPDPLDRHGHLQVLVPGGVGDTELLEPVDRHPHITRVHRAHPYEMLVGGERVREVEPEAIDAAWVGAVDRFAARDEGEGFDEHAHWETLLPAAAGRLTGRDDLGARTPRCDGSHSRERV